MKKSLILLALLSIISITATAQQFVTGIYLNAQDFNEGKKSFTSVDQKKMRIQLHNTFNKPYVTIISPDSVVTYRKTNIFGYTTTDNNTYRFYNNDTYQVLDQNTGLLLYKQDLLMSGKGAQHKIDYYFSNGAASPLIPLTLDNLKSVYGNDTSFLARVYDHFTGDDALIQYNSNTRTYKLSSIYNQYAIKH